MHMTNGNIICGGCLSVCCKFLLPPASGGMLTLRLVGASSGQLLLLPCPDGILKRVTAPAAGARVHEFTTLVIKQPAYLQGGGARAWLGGCPMGGLG